MSANQDIRQALVEILRLQLVMAGNLFTITERVHKIEEATQSLLSEHTELADSFRESITKDIEVAKNLDKETREQISATLEALEGVSRG